MIVLEYGVEIRNVSCIYYSQSVIRFFGFYVQAITWHPFCMEFQLFKEYKKSIQVHTYLLTNLWDLRQKKTIKKSKFWF